MNQIQQLTEFKTEHIVNLLKGQGSNQKLCETTAKFLQTVSKEMTKEYMDYFAQGVPENNKNKPFLSEKVLKGVRQAILVSTLLLEVHDKQPEKVFSTEK